MGRQPHGPLAIDDFPGGLQAQTGTVEGVRRYMRCVCVLREDWERSWWLQPWLVCGVRELV